MKFLYLAILVLCSKLCHTQTPAGDRILGMHLEASENADFAEAIEISQAACANSTHLFMPWSRLESTPGQFDGDLVPFLDIADLYYPAFGISVEINVAPTNTVTREVPSDLVEIAWDDPDMIDRYNTLVDTVFAHIPNLELEAFMVGNESDVMWANNVAEVEQFMTFFEAVKAHIEEVYLELHGTDLKVGTTLTYNGLISPQMSSVYHDLNELADVVSVTYYHIGADFNVLPAAELNARWDALADLYNNPEKPIYFVECGSPTSSVLNGSELHQADFVSAVFESWDEHYDQIKLVYYFMLHDWSQEFVDELAIYYGLEGNVAFTEYLRTLGLRNYPGDGSDKLGMERFRCEADARGFCDASCTIAIPQLEASPLVVFPNPASEFVSVESARGAIFTIYNMLGELVWSQYRPAGRESIPVSDLPEGVYLMLSHDQTGQSLSCRLEILR